MANVATGLTTASGMFKKRYEKQLRDLRSKCSIIQKLVPFDGNQAKVGDSYNIGVAVKLPQGFTYTGASATSTTLNDAVPSEHKQLAVTSYENILREQIIYKALSEATAQGEAAFGNLMDKLVVGLMKALSNRLELALLHGQRGFGALSTTVTDNTTSCTATITATDWSSGIFNLLGTGAYLDAMTSTTVNNSNALLNIKSWDPANKQVELNYDTGTIANEITTGDVLFPKGSHGSTPKDMVGLLYQGANTTGSPFGLSATTYGVLASNTKAVNAALDWRTFQDALDQVRARSLGEENGRYVALVGKAYSQLVADWDDMRAADQSWSKAKASVGVQAIDIATPVLGTVSLVYHPAMKDGEVYVFDPEDCVRGGAHDPSFKLVGKGEGDAELFQFVANTDAVELQCYYNQFIVNRNPGNQLLMTGITT
jgi:hypothetical protein